MYMFVCRWGSNPSNAQHVVLSSDQMVCLGSELNSKAPLFFVSLFFIVFLLYSPTYSNSAVHQKYEHSNWNKNCTSEMFSFCFPHLSVLPLRSVVLRLR